MRYWPRFPHGIDAIACCFTLLYETGMRVGEALALHSTDVHLNTLDGGFLRVIGKGDRERIVPLIDAPRSVRLLRPLLEKGRLIRPLFHGDVSKGGSQSEAMDYTTVFCHFERCLASARHAKPAVFAGDPDPITIHRLRHTYATERLRAGVSLAAVRKLLGHQNLQTTLHYAEIDLALVKQELVEERRHAAQSGRRLGPGHDGHVGRHPVRYGCPFAACAPFAAAPGP